MKPISLQEAEYVAHRLVVEMMDYGEPIGDFATRYPNKLESCLAQPFATFDGVDLYRSIEAKATVLFYTVNKNHPFLNGNKRMAVMLLIYFLYKNNRSFKITTDDLYSLALLVADSKEHLDEYLPKLESSLSKFIEITKPE